MIDDLGLGIIVSLKDAFTQNAQRISGAMNSLDSTVAAASERISANMDRIQKGTMMVGAGLALMAVPAALITSTAATQKALGELASLGVQDLNAIEDAAESFSNTWAGTGKAQFVGATYDIKSALSKFSYITRLYKSKRSRKSGIFELALQTRLFDHHHFFGKYFRPCCHAI